MNYAHLYMPAGEGMYRDSQQEHNSNNLNNTFITHYYKYNQHNQRLKNEVLLKLVSHNHNVSIKIGLHKCELSSIDQ